MKSILTLLTAAVMLAAAPSATLRAQTASATTEADTKASLAMGKNIIQLIGELAKDFSTVKGEQITKTDDGTLVYAVKDMDVMKAASQFIIVKSGGAAYYVANYKDSKELSMSLAAFTAGVTMLTNNDGNFTIENDKAKSTSDKVVFVMSVKGTKVGSYTMETKKSEGTMIIGFL